ncbi:hypothetical protein ACTWP6_22055 [Mycobacterium sp. 4D054]|uniref:hypothetical protein n=1 Tax=Mycobacterium sp. 4D054 TaxID=3457440 RepID=UPI003FCF8533
MTGPFESTGLDKSGEITVFCDAESHPLWEHTFERRGDGPWEPEPFQSVGGSGTGYDAGLDGAITTPRRGGGIEYIDAAGRVVPIWDSGRGITDTDGAARFVSALDGARAAAGAPPDTQLALGRRYQVRCPQCGDSVRRTEAELKKQFDLLWERDCFRISLNGLRAIAKMSKKA